MRHTQPRLVLNRFETWRCLFASLCFAVASPTCPKLRRSCGRDICLDAGKFFQPIHSVLTRALQLGNLLASMGETEKGVEAFESAAQLAHNGGEMSTLKRVNCCIGSVKANSQFENYLAEKLASTSF